MLGRVLREKEMNWKVGDVAICVTPGSPMENKEVIILSPALPRLDKIDLVHEVDPGFSAGPNAGWGAERRHLWPLPDPNELSTWDECVFTPEETVSC